MSKLCKSTVVMLLSCAVSLTVLEVVLRYTSPLAEAEMGSFLFSEHPDNFRDQHRDFGYKALSQNREIAIYSDYDHAWVEFDVSFTVNNAGLVQLSNIDPTKPYTILVGDSFTQGHGAVPWFYELENEFPRPLANLGIPAIGVSHFAKAIDWFQNTQAMVDKVFIIIIADDFFRPYWWARSSESAILICYAETWCSTTFTKWHDGTPQAVIEKRISELMRTERIKIYLRSILYRFEIGKLLLSLNQSIKFRTRRDYFDDNKLSFQDLIRRYPVALVLHLPEKHEAQLQRWFPRSQEVRQFIQNTGVQYIDGLDKCGLESNDYYKADGHPNKTGYQKIKACVGELLAGI
jgi:hypothetical protein